MRSTVLVLGDDARSCLTVVRSLGRQGIEVVLGTQQSESIVRHSRYVASVLPLPPFALGREDWQARLDTILKERAFSLVIPTSDSYLVPIAFSRDRFAGLARLAIPAPHPFEHSYFKDKTLAVAQELGVPSPRSLLVGTYEELKRTLPSSGFELPVILKPVSSKVWREGERRDLHVKLARTWPECYQFAEDLLRYSPLLVQSYFRGTGVGQEFLAHNGDILVGFQHRRVHESQGGGGSSYRVSEALDPEMLSCSSRILKRLQWTGVVMVEYKQAPSGEGFALMEINGRFWGSLPLAVACGVDFPYYLYQLLVEGKTEFTSSYPAGIFGRNLANDFWWFFRNLRVDGTDPYSHKTPLRRALLEPAPLLRGRERWDEWTWDDLRPAVRTLYRLAGDVARSLAARALSAPSNALWRTRTWRMAQRRRHAGRLGAVSRLLIVCRGNICRSPFAEAYLKTKGLPLAVRSAGTGLAEGRQPPEQAQLVAREFGVDLSLHRSQTVTGSLANWADLVVCMDLKNYAELRKAFPAIRGKLVVLKWLQASAREAEISDPWGKEERRYRTCFGEIRAALDEMLRVALAEGAGKT